MRGLPGSGKSTEARKLAADHIYQNGGSAAILSTDDYHMIGGKYSFQPGMLSQFHKLNQSKAERFMRCDVELIIIDNTNIHHKDMKPYKDSAKMLAYEIKEIIIGKDELFPSLENACPHKFMDYMHMCADRNIHSVPLEAIEKMARGFENETTSND